MQKHCYIKSESVEYYNLLRDLPEEIKTQYAKILLSIVKEKSILDLGFGTGNVLIYLSKLNKVATIHGIDNSHEMFLSTKQQIANNSNLFYGELSDFVRKFGKVDYLHFKAILHCLKDPEKLINEIINSIKVGGAIITSHEISQTEDRIEQLFDYSKIDDRDIESIFHKYFKIRINMNLPFTPRRFPAGNSDYVSDYLVKTDKFIKEEDITSEVLYWKRNVKIDDILEAVKKGTFGVFSDGISPKNRIIIYKKLISFCHKSKINIFKNRILPCRFKINLLRRCS